MSSCHHYRYESTLEPTFSQRIEMRDGVRTAVAVLNEPPPVAEMLSDDFVVAKPVFYDRDACPICAGGACPEGDDDE
jgi:hypothetical protein